VSWEYVIPNGPFPTAYIYHRIKNFPFCALMYILKLSFLEINIYSLPAMDMCTPAKLESLYCQDWWESFSGSSLFTKCTIDLYFFHSLASRTDLGWHTGVDRELCHTAEAVASGILG